MVIGAHQKRASCAPSEAVAKMWIKFYFSYISQDTLLSNQLTVQVLFSFFLPFCSFPELNGKEI